jgi:hypothetical protein
MLWNRFFLQLNQRIHNLEKANQQSPDYQPPLNQSERTQK